jgi:tetrahydromethanopterin S-methyltransferase subunit E
VTYTAKNANQLRGAKGTQAEILAREFGLIDTELDTLTTAVNKAKIKYLPLTAGLGTRTAVATTGVDLASGADAVYYGVFAPGVAVTIVGMVTVLNEAYVKNSTDAVITLKDRTGTPVTKVAYTLPLAGSPAKTIVTTTPASASLASTDILDLYITATGASGTGYADVFLKYTID